MRAEAADESDVPAVAIVAVVAVAFGVNPATVW
jgi:hypothetical protein